MQPQMAAMPRWLLLNDAGKKTPRRLAADRRSAASHAHVAGQRRALVAAVDDEVVPLGLAGDGFVDGRVQRLVALRGAQRRTEIGGVLLAEAHIERAGAGNADAV